MPKSVNETPVLIPQVVTFRYTGVLPRGNAHLRSITSRDFLAQNGPSHVMKRRLFGKPVQGEKLPPLTGFPHEFVGGWVNVQGEDAPGLNNLLRLHCGAYNWLHQDLTGNPSGKKKSDFPTGHQVFGTYHLVFNDLSRDLNRFYGALIDPAMPGTPEVFRRINNEIELLTFRLDEVSAGLKAILKRWRAEQASTRVIEAEQNVSNYLADHGDAFTVGA